MTGLGLSLLAGCGVSLSSLSGSGPVSEGASIIGNIHGGQSPVYNATLTLYEAGYTGYGTGSVALAQTTSDTGGGFQFNKNAGTATPTTTLTNTYACDTAKPTAQIYILATGGNTQGTGTTSTNNTAASFITAIGPCNAISSATRVNINELSTAATVYALAQYISPGSVAGGTRIGTSASTQGTTGLNNAVAQIANLTNIGNSSLTSIQAPQYTGTNSSVSGITVTAAADYPKLVDVANILASCVNQSTATSATNCADLFNNATAPTPVNTSQPSATFTTATDAVQAAYFLATNPGLVGTVPTCNNSSSSTTKASCLFGLISSTAPFQTGTSTAPTDYTIGVNYTATGTCAGGSFISGPYHANVDASGNLWFINGAANNATIAEN